MMQYMHLLRTIFGLRGLYSIKKRGQYFVEALYWLLGLCVGLGVFTSGGQSEGVRLLCLLILYAVLIYYVREIVQTNYFNQVVREHHEVAESVGNLYQRYLNSAVLREYDTRSGHTLKCINLQKDDPWSIYDILVDEERSTKYGDYLARQNGHTVFEAKLQRVLPNIVFDDKRAHGQQFRSSFISSQKLSFEGNFDQFFGSYAPQTYHIDTFSFISPEVLHAMVDFTIPCDVEIVDDRLLCYAPIVPVTDLESFRQQCLNLYRNLNDNVDTYRDNRLMGKDRQVSVMPFARKLLDNPLAHWVSMLILGVLTIGIIILAIALHDIRVLWNELCLMVMISFVVEVGRAIKIAYSNHREIQRFERMKGFVQMEEQRKKMAVLDRRVRPRI